MSEDEHPPTMPTHPSAFFARFEPRTDPHFAHLSFSVNEPTFCQKIPDAPVSGHHAELLLCRHCQHIWYSMLAEATRDEAWDGEETTASPA